MSDRSVEPYEVRTVTCPERNNVHLAMAPDPGRTAHDTLCGLPVASTRPAIAFLADGCLMCAQVATDLGVATASDHRGATIDLGRYVTSRRD